MGVFIVVRTLTFSSTQQEVDHIEPVPIQDEAVERFQKSIQFPTISFNDTAKFNAEPFKHFWQFIDSTYATVDSLFEKKSFGLSRLYKWQGTDPSLNSVILMGHIDVVPVDESTLSEWEAPPFSAEQKNGKIYGRGSMDDKVNVISLLEASEMLLTSGFQPTHTLYFAFGHDEEIGGPNGAKKMAEYLKELRVKAEFVMDEGGYIAEGMVPGLEKPLALINTAEKGYVSFKLSITTQGGHSSNPPIDNTIGSLAKAITELESNQFEYRMLPVLESQIERIGPEFDSFISKMAFANTWLFRGQVLEALNAHTTIAPTIIEGGIKDNVIPTTASVVVNFRVMPGQTIEEVKNHITCVLSDPRVHIENYVDSNEPSMISSDESDAFKLLEKTIRQLHPECIVSPGLLGGGTDSKHFADISENIYRFFPTRINPDNVTGFHGTNEYMSIKNYKETIQFSYHLMSAL